MILPGQPILTLALAKPLLELDAERLLGVLPLLAPVSLLILWWRGWLSVADPAGIAAGKGGGGAKRSKRNVDRGGDANLEPPVDLMVGIGFQLAFMVVLSVLGTMPAAWAGPPKSLQHLGTVLGLGAFIGVAGVLIMLRLLSGGGWLGRGWYSIRGLDVARGAGVLLLVYPVLALAGWLGAFAFRLITDRAPDVLSHDSLKQIAQDPKNMFAWMVIAAAIVGVPIVEEFVYRGCVLRGAVGAMRMPRTALVIVSAIFALVHLGNVGPESLPTLFLLAIAMGMATLRTGRLGIAVGMHMSFNALNVLLALLLPSAS